MMAEGKGEERRLAGTPQLISVSEEEVVSHWCIMGDKCFPHGDDLEVL